MKATLLVGGPEPADGGRLNIIRYASSVCKARAITDIYTMQRPFGIYRGPYKEGIWSVGTRRLQEPRHPSLLRLS